MFGPTVNTHHPPSPIIGLVAINFPDSSSIIILHAAKMISSLIADHRARQYWHTYNQAINHPLIDSTTLQHAASHTSLWQRRWMSKWSAGMCGVGKWLKHLKEQNHSQCSRCTSVSTPRCLTSLDHRFREYQGLDYLQQHSTRFS